MLLTLPSYLIGSLLQLNNHRNVYYLTHAHHCYAEVVVASVAQAPPRAYRPEKCRYDAFATRRVGLLLLLPAALLLLLLT